MVSPPPLWPLEDPLLVPTFPGKSLWADWASGDLQAEDPLVDRIVVLLYADAVTWMACREGRSQVCPLLHPTQVNVDTREGVLCSPSARARRIWLQPYMGLTLALLLLLLHTTPPPIILDYVATLYCTTAHWPLPQNLPFKIGIRFLELFMEHGYVWLFKFGLAIHRHFREPLLAAKQPNALYKILRLEHETDSIDENVLSKALQYDLSGKDIPGLRQKMYDTIIGPRLEKARQLAEEAEDDDMSDFSDEDEE